MGPGILWSDTRSHELMSDLLRRPGFDRRYFADTGTHLQPCNTSLQLYWLKQYQRRGWRPRAICFSPRTGSAFA